MINETATATATAPVARLVKERDEARSALSSAQALGPTSAAGGKRGAAAMDVDEGGAKKASKSGVSQEAGQDTDRHIRPLIVGLPA